VTALASEEKIRMDPWNIVSAVAAVVSAVGAIGALFVAAKSRKESKVSADASKVSADASKVSADASKVSADASKEAVAVAQQALRDDHDYQRRLYAAELISRWDERTLHARTAIMKRWSERFTNNEAIPRSEIVDEFNKEVKPNSRGTHPIMVYHFGTVLNYLDDVAMAVMFEVGDNTMLKAAFEATFKRWMRVLGEYREYVKGIRQMNPWARPDSKSAAWDCAREVC
jgi:hypothetical protein